MMRFAVVSVLALGLGLVFVNAGQSSGRRSRGVVYYTPVYYPPVSPVVITTVPVFYPVPVSSPAPVSSPSAGDNQPSPAAVFQFERYLRVRNQTGETVTIFLQYRTRDEKGAWAWMPQGPGTDAKVISFELAAGKELDLARKLSASRVRLWAKSATTVWDDYMNLDLWLVPETGPRGEHRYQATETHTFTYTLQSKTNDGDR